MSQIRCPIRENSVKISDQFAFQSATEKISYGELDHKISLAASLLASREVLPQSRVCITGSNSLEFIVFFFAVIRLQAVACTISNKFPHRLFSQHLERINCKFLIETDSDDEKLINSRQREIYISKINWLTSPMSLQREAISLETIEVQYSAKSNSRTEKKPIWITEDQDCTITFTSGTSGQAKAVVHTYGNHWYNALGANENLAVQPGDRWALSLSLFHIGGLAILFRCFASGAAVVLDSKLTPTLEFLKERQITHLSLVPAQMKMLYDQPESLKILQDLKVILLGGDNISTKLITETRNNGLPVYSTYGLTEMASQVTTTTPDGPPSSHFTSGKLLRYRELKISEDGEILVKGKTLFKKCTGALENQDSRSWNGWYSTGDLGFLDQDGNLSVRGRKDNRFISGGENISPEEIEAVIRTEKGVSQVVVVPIRDEEYGNRPIAFIQTKDSKNLSSQNIKSLCKEHLPGFKVPIAFYQWPGNNDAGALKIDRNYFQNIAKNPSTRLSLF